MFAQVTNDIVIVYNGLIPQKVIEEIVLNVMGLGGE